MNELQQSDKEREQMTLPEALRHHAALMLAPEVDPLVRVKLMDAAVLMNGAADILEQSHNGLAKLESKLDGILAQRPSGLPPAEWHDLNLNDVVRVKLTGVGRKMHREHHEELAEFMRERKGPFHDYTPPKEDADGWYETQLWSLAHDYGEKMSLGFDVPVETTIQVRVPRPSAPSSTAAIVQTLPLQPQPDTVTTTTANPDTPFKYRMILKFDGFERVVEGEYPAQRSARGETFEQLFERTLTPDAIAERLDALRWRAYSKKLCADTGVKVSFLEQTVDALIAASDETASKA